MVYFQSTSSACARSYGPLPRSAFNSLHHRTKVAEDRIGESEGKVGGGGSRLHSSAQIMKQQQQKREGRVVRRLEPRVPGSCSAPWSCLSPSPFPGVLTCAWGRRRTGKSACVSIHCCHLLGGIGSLFPPDSPAEPHFGKSMGLPAPTAVSVEVFLCRTALMWVLQPGGV